MAGDQRHIHDPATAEEFARALGLQVGGAGYPFVGNWGTKGLYAYRSGQYNGIAYFGTGGSERDRLTMPHESEKYRPWNRYDPDIPAHIRKKLIELEDDETTSIGQPPQPAHVQPSSQALRTGWYRMELADGSVIGRARVQRNERNTSATNEFIATGDLTGDVMWYVEGNTVKVPKFGSTGTIQADGNITWSPDGKKAMYEGNAGDPSTGEQSIRNGVGKIALKSVHGKYLSAQPDGRAEWNRTVACGWEFFELSERNGRKITLRSTHGKYVSAQPDGTVQINRDYAPPGGWEEFTVETRPGSTPGDAHDFLNLKSVHGKYLSAQADGTAQWNRDHAPPGGWEDIQFVPQVSQNKEQVSIKHQQSIEILEAVTGKPVRFKLNSPPNHNDAWVGIYPTGASDQDHGAQNNRWKWLRDIDANNASFPKQIAGSHSIRVFSDGGYKLHERKDFQVKAQTLATQPLDDTAQKQGRGGIRFAVLFGLFLMLLGLPLVIVGSISTAEGRLGMLIPGAVFTSFGGFALFMSIVAVIKRGPTETENHSSVMVYQEAVDSASTNIEVLSFNHNQPIRFRINNPPPGGNAWVGIYPVDAEDREHDDRWKWLRDIEVDNATLPGQSKGMWSIRLFSDGGYTLHERTDFEILEGYKNEVWMRNARIEASRIIGDMIDHPTFGNMNRRTSMIIKRTKHGNMHRFETNNTTYLIKDEDLADEVNVNEPFWGNA